MLRTILVAFVVLFITSPVIAQKEVAPTTLDWGGINIELYGWIDDGESVDHDTELLLKRFDGAALVPKIWVRYEYRSLQSPGQYKSIIDLQEVRCAQRQLRIIQETSYSDNNLKGDILDSGNITGVWSYASPGTMGESILDAACWRPRRKK